jgi:hypothetical protein
MRPYFQAVDSARQAHGKVLVFIPESEARPRIFWKMYWYNATDFLGDVIVARDLGARNEILTRRFGDHVPVRLEWQRSPSDAPLLRPYAEGSERAQARSALPDD